MKSKLIEILESLNYPVFLQGSLNQAEEYPDSFFTFWVFAADEVTHYNNQPCACEWGFWIYFYSVDPEKVEKIPIEAKNILRSAGFVFECKPVDASSGRETHTGAMLTCYFKEVY